MSFEISKLNERKEIIFLKNSSLIALKGIKILAKTLYIALIIISFAVFLFASLFLPKQPLPIKKKPFVLIEPKPTPDLPKKINLPLRPLAKLEPLFSKVIKPRPLNPILSEKRHDPDKGIMFKKISPPQPIDDIRHVHTRIHHDIMSRRLARNVSIDLLINNTWKTYTYETAANSEHSFLRGNYLSFEGVPRNTLVVKEPPFQIPISNITEYALSKERAPT